MTAPSDGVPDTPTVLQVAEKALRAQFGENRFPDRFFKRLAEAVLAALLSTPLAETQWGIGWGLQWSQGTVTPEFAEETARLSQRGYKGTAHLVRRQRLVVETEWKDADQ